MLIRLILCAVLLPVTATAAQDAASNAAEVYRRAFAAMPEDINTMELIEDPINAPLDEHAQELVRRCDQSLALLRQAATVPKCDWGIDYSTGPMTLLPHIQQGRQLAGVAVLRARLAFQDGNHADGVAYLLATMHMARHVGSEPFIIGRLVGCNMEDMAIGVLGEQLPALPKDSLASLSAGLKSLPATPTLAQALRSESKILCDWIAATPEAPDEFVQELPNVNEVRQLWSDPAARATAVENLRKLFDEAATLLDLPEDRWRAALSKWQDQVHDSDALSRNFPPNLEYLRNGLGRCTMRPALLEAAIKVIRAGPDAVQKTKDPAGDGPFGYDKTESGFILSSSATVRGEPVTLKVGP